LAIELHPFFGGRIGLPDRGRRADDESMRKSNPQEIQNPRNGPAVIMTKILVGYGKWQDLIAVKKIGPDFLRSLGGKEAFLDQFEIESWFSDGLFARGDDPVICLHRASFGDRLSQFVPSSELDAAKPGEGGAQQLDLARIGCVKFSRFPETIDESG
jgi:hypothetical protein